MNRPPSPHPSRLNVIKETTEINYTSYVSNNYLLNKIEKLENEIDTVKKELENLKKK
jgi:hypothetical protein